MFGISRNTVRTHRNRSKWGKANQHETVKHESSKSRDAVSSDSFDSKPNNHDQVSSKSNGLNDRQMNFCRWYLLRYNATQAYINAYDSDYNTARANGSKLLANTDIQAYLHQLKKDESKRLMINTDDMMKDLIKQAKANIGDYIDFRTIKVKRLDMDGNEAQDADGNPIYDYSSQIYLKDKNKMDLTPVAEMHKGKDGIVVKLENRQRAIIELLDRLPEPQADQPKENPFLKAWKLSPDKDDQHLFDDHPNDFEIHKAEDEDTDN